MTLLLFVLNMEMSMIDGYNRDFYYECFATKNTIEQSFYVTAGIECYTPNKIFYAKASAKCLIYSKTDQFGFVPMALSSYAEIGFNLGPISIGWIHTCLHPVVPYLNNHANLPTHDEGYEEFFIAIKSNPIAIKI